jgi:Kef-type K+ transport system membrane component KefB
VLCGVVFALLGLAFGFPWPIAALVGASLALSSTAVVGRILADRNQPACPMGRSATRPCWWRRTSWRSSC